jgi:hypothetical protein
MTPKNILRVGATRSGKSMATARHILECHGMLDTDELIMETDFNQYLDGVPACTTIVFDPHPDSLAAKLLTHATGNVLYDNLSNLKHTLGYNFLRPSTNPNPLERLEENERKAERFVAILLRRRGGEGLSRSPQIEEWTFLVLNLFFRPRSTETD